MNNFQRGNSYRRSANAYEEVANNWLTFAKDKKHSKDLRIKAAQRYRDNMRKAKERREQAEMFKL